MCVKWNSRALRQTIATSFLTCALVSTTTSLKCGMAMAVPAVPVAPGLVMNSHASITLDLQHATHIVNVRPHRF